MRNCETDNFHIQVSCLHSLLDNDFTDRARDSPLPMAILTVWSYNYNSAQGVKHLECRGGNQRNSQDAVDGGAGSI